MRGLALLFVAIILAGCASDAPAAAQPEFPDVHGVAFDPLDPDAVYVATHAGLYHGNAEHWMRVGNVTHDLMGFTLAADGRTAFASGHPRGGGNLGLIRSTDAGESWVPIGAAGADFHALAVSPADPARIYGYFRGAILRTDDGGARWLEVAEVDVAALAAHPTEREVIYAATTAAIGRSEDGGATWTQIALQPAYGIATTGNGTLFIGGKDFVSKSLNDGADWTSLTAPGEGTFAHVAARGNSVLVASYAGGVWRSDNGGSTWSELHAP
jgi:hypothetical protein